MAKKKKEHPLKRKYTVHKKLEEPVHNLLGYTVLFALTVAVLLIVYGTRAL